MSHKLNIFLDDLRVPLPGFTIVRSVEECLLLMAEVEVDKLSLDYHLGTGRTADEVTHWIVKTGRWPAEVYLHSSDLEARQHMLQYLSTHAPASIRIYPHRYVDQE